MGTVPLNIDCSLATPEENLALDEALLLAGAEVLRFWESGGCFVAVGVSGRLEEEVDLEACRREDVPVLRRASGGGTVVQGPGCLNFALVLSLELRPELRDVTRGYSLILSRIAGSLGVPGLEPRGISDLAIGDRKVSGNAQKRTRRAILHHGTILHAFDLERIPRLLKDPRKQPEYRRRRPHEEFVSNLALAPAEIKARIANAWEAEPAPETFRLPALADLIREKYANAAWTRRF